MFEPLQACIVLHLFCEVKHGLALIVFGLQVNVAFSKDQVENLLLVTVYFPHHCQMKQRTTVFRPDIVRRLRFQE